MFMMALAGRTIISWVFTKWIRSGEMFLSDFDGSAAVHGSQHWIKIKFLNAALNS